MKLESILKRTVRVIPPPKLKVLPTLLRESSFGGSAVASLSKKQHIPFGGATSKLAERSRDL